MNINRTYSFVNRVEMNSSSWTRIEISVSHSKSSRCLRIVDLQILKMKDTKCTRVFFTTSEELYQSNILFDIWLFVCIQHA